MGARPFKTYQSFIEHLDQSWTADLQDFCSLLSTQELATSDDVDSFSGGDVAQQLMQAMAELVAERDILSIDDQ